MRGAAARTGAGSVAAAAFGARSANTASGTHEDRDLVDLLEQPQAAQVVGAAGEVAPRSPRRRPSLPAVEVDADAPSHAAGPSARTSRVAVGDAATEIAEKR